MLRFLTDLDPKDGQQGMVQQNGPKGPEKTEHEAKNRKPELQQLDRQNNKGIQIQNQHTTGELSGSRNSLVQGLKNKHE